MQRTWIARRKTLAVWGDELGNRIAKLDRYAKRLSQLHDVWQRTLDTARADDASPDLLQRVELLLASIAQARAELEKQHDRLDTLASRVAAQEFRTADAVDSVRQAQASLLAHILQRDAPPIWIATPSTAATSAVAVQTQEWSAEHANALATYAAHDWGRFLLHLVAFAIVALPMFLARRAIRRRMATDAGLRDAEPVFSAPIPSAWLLTLALTQWLYQDAPRSLFAMLAAVAVVPAVVVMRPITPAHRLPVVHALAVLFVLDEVRALATSVLPRWIMLGEMVGGLVFLAWYVRTCRRAETPPPGAKLMQLRKRSALAGLVAFAFFAVTAAANAFGYVSLADLLGGAYVGVALYAAVQIFDALVVIALRTRPLGVFAMVRQHTDLLRTRTRRAGGVAAAVAWLLHVLDRVALRDRAISGLHRILDAHTGVGSIHITLGNVIAFAIAVWASFAVSRFIRFVLDEEVYPRAKLGRGVPNAISKTLHYVIILIGFFVAMGALGVDMTKFTILASAFTVGVGFGLQQIFNNFVSGIILLFERPVKVGDVIDMSGATGVVERIGMRASVLRTTTGAEVIVPNSNIIQNQLTNWTLAERKRGIEVKVNVAGNSDPKTVIATLERIAAAHSNVLKEPPPQALVTKVGDPLEFTLTAYTDRVAHWLQVTSELAATVPAAFAREDITLK